MNAHAAEWGCTTTEGFPMAKYLAARNAKLRVMVTSITSEAPMDGPPLVGQTPTTAATAACVAKAPLARPAVAHTESGASGESLLPKRDTPKDGTRLPAQARASPTQEAREACGRLQREEERQARFARRRDETVRDEAEALADLAEFGVDT